MPLSESLEELWNFAKSMDENIKSASDRMRLISIDAERELAERYMKLRDVSKIEELEREIKEKFAYPKGFPESLELRKEYDRMKSNSQALADKFFAAYTILGPNMDFKSVSSKLLEDKSTKKSIDTYLNFEDFSLRTSDIVKLLKEQGIFLNIINSNNMFCALHFNNGRIVNFSSKRNLFDYLKEHNIIQIKF